MHGVALLVIGLAAAGGLNEYSRGLDARSFDQTAFDAETYGAKKALARTPGGLRITLEPGTEETGWKTPQALKIGGDFTISVNLVVTKVPKPAQDDGAAVGIAIAQGDINQPDLTLVRLKEPSGSDVYRAIDRGANTPGQGMQPGEPPFMQPGQPNAKGAKPPRRVFPAAGEAVRLELTREKNIVRFQVVDAKESRPRYLGQVSLGTNDIAAVKLFVSNRNGAEDLDVVWKDLTIRADRLGGLGTSVRTVFNTIVYAEPTAIEKGVLIVGGPPKNPPPAAKPSEARDMPQEVVDHPFADAPVPPAAPALAAARAAPDSPPASSPAPAAAPAKDSKPNEPKEQKPEPKQEPKARIPLEEVETIRFERTPALAARFLGQKNVDLTGPAPDAKKDEAKPNDEAKPKESKDEAKKDEVKKDEAKKDEANKDEAKKDEVKKDEAKKDEANKDEAKRDEVKKDQPKKDVAKKAEVKKDEAKKDAVSDDALAPPPGTTTTKVPRVNPEKNGIRDVGLALSGLRNAEIKQVTVNCQTDKGPAGWRLDTSDSHDWPLVVRRSGTEPWAELYLEPPPGDSFEKEYRINVVYADGQNGNATIKAIEHTDPRRSLDTKEPEAIPPGATVYLTGDERVFGTLEGIGPDVLRLVSPWRDQAPLEIPLARVVGVQLSVANRKETPESFARRLKSRGAQDLLLARTKDGEILSISGVVEGTEADRLQFRYQDRTRTLPLSQVEGWVMAARPDPKAPEGLRARISLFGDLAISGVWKDLDTQTWKLEAPWGQELKVPAAEVQEVRFRGGAMTYLSDLVPSQVEETAFFGHRMPWRRDVGLLGEPLRMTGQSYERGVAVHSRSHLTYDLNGRYSRFEALLGFDDSGRGKGRIDCRVIADGKQLFAKTDLRANEPPLALSLPVAGATQLRLEVDFGRDQDTGDRVIWANARLYRPTSSEGRTSQTSAVQGR
jgi:hypothetical protein